jgi:biotin carboxylase
LIGGNTTHRRARPEAILVVGTTPDYVCRLHKAASEPLLFLTDARFQGDPQLKAVPASRLVFAHLDSTGELPPSAFSGTVSISGVACFDCESLLLASRLADRLELPFPPWQAIVRSRNKFEARRIWTAAGIGSPFASLSAELEETLAFFHHHGEDIVLKPLSGSGSELLFHCTKEHEVRAAVMTMKEELPRRKTNPLFYPFPDPVYGHEIDPCRVWIAEEFVSGEEFSCDFVYHGEEIFVIRETGKVKALNKPFGSVLAYTFPPVYPEGFRKEQLPKVFKKAVTCLGFDWGFFMVDFVVRGGLPVIIELTPRPGGDSIPDLLKVGAGCDTLSLYLRFVTRRFQPPPEISLRPHSFASINLYAPKEGRILHLDGEKIRSLPHVRHFFFKKKKGDRVILPPKDYDHRLLGYCVVALEPGADVTEECQRLEDLLEVSIES